MSKELRANLIFLCILVLVVGPGFFILMKKKLTGPTTPNYLPDPVQHAVAYVHPPGSNPNLPRVEPPEARTWITQILHDRFDPTASPMLMPDRKSPLLSDRYVSQALLLDQTQSGLTRFVFIIWDDKVATPSVTFVTRDGQSHQTDVTSESIDLPSQTLHALQNIGYPFALTQVKLIIATDAQMKPDQLATVTITSVRGDKTTQETIHVQP